MALGVGGAHPRASRSTSRTRTVVTLERNYRSTQPILDTANAAGRAGDAGVPEAAASRAARAAAGRSCCACRDEAEQAHEVCERVLAAREQGIDLRHQAVLMRTSHDSDLLELELARRQIPFVKYGGLRYLEAAHVKDLIALFRLVGNPGDELVVVPAAAAARRRRAGHGAASARRDRRARRQATGWRPGSTARERLPAAARPSGDALVDAARRGRARPMAPAPRRSGCATRWRR